MSLIESLVTASRVSRIIQDNPLKSLNLNRFCKESISSKVIVTVSRGQGMSLNLGWGIISCMNEWDIENMLFSFKTDDGLN